MGKHYDAPHVGGTNGVFMGSNGGGNGWARRVPRRKYKRQALSAVAPPFALSFGYGHGESKVVTPAQAAAAAVASARSHSLQSVMRPPKPTWRPPPRHAVALSRSHAVQSYIRPAKPTWRPPRFAQMKRPVFPARRAPAMKRPAMPRFGIHRPPLFSRLDRREAPHSHKHPMSRLEDEYNTGPTSQDEEHWNNDWQGEPEEAASGDEAASRQEEGKWVWEEGEDGEGDWVWEEPPEEGPPSVSSEAPEAEEVAPQDMPEAEEEGKWVWEEGEDGEGDWVWEEPEETPPQAEEEAPEETAAEEAQVPEEVTAAEEAQVPAEVDAMRPGAVATGYPAAYDGRWGDQYYRNAGGNEGAMRDAGVNYDDYPLDVYRSIPFLHFDPSATKQREQSQKIRAGKKLDVTYTQQTGANAGGKNEATGWGTWIEGGAAEDHVRSAGINLDTDPLNFESGFPNPAWDKSEFDQARHIPLKPTKDAWEMVKKHRESQKKLQAAGVKLNGFPIDKPEPRVFNHIDGIMDTLIKTDDTPKYRDSGVATQERPLHFLLDDDINGKPTSQADGINKVFLPGDLDKVRQNVEDRQQGIELHPTKPVSWAEAGWPAEEPPSQEPAEEEEPPSQEPAEEEEEPPSQEPAEEEEEPSQEPTPSVSSEEPEAEAPQEEPQEEGATSQVVHKYEYM